MPTAQSSSKSSSSSAKSANKNNNQAGSRSGSAAGNNADADKLNKETEALKISTEESTTTAAAASASGTKTPPDQPEFIKQSLGLIEKKARNLDKRRIKLDEYKALAQKGTTLNEDQSSAVSRYDEVLRSIELMKELEKAFNQFGADAMKQQKKQAKRDQMEKDEAVSEAVKSKLKEAQRCLTVLRLVAQTEVREDFARGDKGAVKLTKNELAAFEEFEKLVIRAEPGTKFDADLATSTEHLLNFIDAKPKKAEPMTWTYADLKKLCDKVTTATYWEKKNTLVATTPEKTVTETKTVNKQNEQPQQQHQQQQAYHNQESTDAGFVVVSNNDIHEATSHHQQQQQQHHQKQQHQQTTSPNTKQPQSPIDFNNQQQQQQQQPHQPQQYKTNTLFTTLTTQHEMGGSGHQDINELINKCENNDDGINFLQDSEVRHQQPQQTQGGDYNQQHDQQRGDGSFRTRGGRGGGNGHGNYQQQRPKYNDERGPRGPMDNRPRGGGMSQQQQGGAPRSTNGPMNGNGPMGQQQQQQQPRDYNNGGRGGYRGPPNNNRGGSGGYSGDRGGYAGERGSYRGGNNNNNGPRQQQQQRPAGHPQQQQGQQGQQQPANFQQVPHPQPVA